MKQVKSTLSLFSIVALSLFMMWSCSYTSNTGGSSHFAKKHYNRGIVKIKNTEKENKTEVVAQNEEEKLTRSEKKEIIKEQVAAFKDGQALTASNEEGVVENDPSTLVSTIKENIAVQKEKAEAQKSVATTNREVKKADKKIAQLARFESLTERLTERISGNYVAPGPDAAAAPADNGLLGLLGGIFGIIGFVFSFAWYFAFLGLLLCIAALVLGIMGLNGSNRGWALAGIILGVLGILLFLVAFLLIFAFFF